jgi:hypothetical protein
MTSDPNRVVDALRRVFERRERDKAPTRTARVLGRNADGTERLQRSDAVCVTRGSVDGHYAGQVILEPASNVFHRQGAVGIAPISQDASADTLWIDSLDPFELRPGESYIITVTGRGFTAGVVIEFLDPADYLVQPSVINPDVTIDSLAVESDTTLSLNVTVAPGARLWSTGAPISFGRP